MPVYGLNRVPQEGLWRPNPQDLRMWAQLELQG